MNGGNNLAKPDARYTIHIYVYVRLLVQANAVVWECQTRAKRKHQLNNIEHTNEFKSYIDRQTDTYVFFKLWSKTLCQKY